MMKELFNEMTLYFKQRKQKNKIEKKSFFRDFKHALSYKNPNLSSTLESFTDS